MSAAEISEGGIYCVNLRFPSGNDPAYDHYVLAMATTDQQRVPVPVYAFLSRFDKYGSEKYDVDPIACVEFDGTEYDFLDHETVIDARAPLYIRLDMQSRYDEFRWCGYAENHHLVELRKRIMYAYRIPIMPPEN